MPHFTKTEADKIIAMITSPPGSYYTCSFDPVTDTYSIMCEQYDGPDLYKGFNIKCNGQIVHVYDIGAGSWTWDEIEDKTKEVKDDE